MSQTKKIIPNALYFFWVEEEIAQGREVRIRHKGTSMLPFLYSDKDEVNLAPCDPATLSPLDVVLFRYKGRHLLHRILRREGERLLLQGDGSLVATEQCLVTDVVARMTYLVRPSGKSLPVTSLRWRVLSRLWVSLRFARRPLLRVVRYIVC